MTKTCARIVQHAYKARLQIAEPVDCRPLIDQEEAFAHVRHCWEP